MDGKTSHEYCELEMIYQVKRLGLVRIMEDMHTITSVYLVCWLFESNHYYIGRKIIVVWSISPWKGKPHESRLMVKSTLIPTCGKHKQTGGLKRGDTTFIFKAIIKTTHIRVMGCLAALYCGLRGGRTVRIFLPPTFSHGLYVTVSLGLCVEIRWDRRTNMRGMGRGKQTRLGWRGTEYQFNLALQELIFT